MRIKSSSHALGTEEPNEDGLDWLTSVIVGIIWLGSSVNVPSVNAANPNPMIPSNKSNPSEKFGTARDCLTGAMFPIVTLSITKTKSEVR